MIPPEIEKLGPEAVEVYLRALDEGEQKIPYCGLLILGRENVGKTSLYRQLVGKSFDENLQSTKGIDNNTVDTVDRRVVDIEGWKEKDGTDTGEQFGDAVINKVVPELPEKAPEKPRKEEGEEVKEEDLMEQIQRVSDKLVELKEREKQAAVHIATPSLPSPTTPTFNHFPSATVYTSQPLTQQPPRAPSSPRMPRREHPPQQENPPQHVRPKVTQKVPVSQPPAAPRQNVEHSLPKQALQNPVPLQGKELATPPRVEPPVGRSGSSGMLNPRQSSRIGDFVKGKRLFQMKEPALVLNALDFAGQKEYRSMHHCFIMRRAIYVVVFKIPDLLDDNQRCNSIEEVRYWIQSIHAHIYPPDESMRDKDETVKRVFLVGTHRGEQKLSGESFREINALIKEKLMNFGKHCVNHICPIELPDYGSSFFIPVENSIDGSHCSPGECYLVESGTKPLQEKIKAMSEDREKLPFLHESHPIKWLKFEEDLKDFSKVKKPPIIKVEEVNDIAADCKISEEDAKNLALHFFHDTGKIIYLSEWLL